MKTIYLSSKSFHYESLSELEEEFSKRNISLGDRCTLGNGCKLGYECKLGYGCELGDGCTLGDGCKLGDWCKLTEIPFYALGLYKYHVSAHYNRGVPYIQLGCFLRTLKEWEDNFWNNTKEFPDNGSEKSEARKFAFDIAKQTLNKKS